LSRAEASTVIEWDCENWRRAANFWGEAVQLEVKGATVLELGAGRGGVSLWFARHGAHVFCTEYLKVPQRAIDNHKQLGIANRIAYGAVDGCSIPFEESFDIVVFKSVLGHLSVNQQKSLIDGAHSALRKGGVLLFCDNLAGTGFHSWTRRHFAHYGKKWNYLHLSNLVGQLGAFEHVQYRTFGLWALFSPWEKGRVLLGMIDGVFDRLVPTDWRYIVSVVAVK
jgi:SAM-dependent methyltransferase